MWFFALFDQHLQIKFQSNISTLSSKGPKFRKNFKKQISEKIFYQHFGFLKFFKKQISEKKFSPKFGFLIKMSTLTRIPTFVRTFDFLLKNSSLTKITIRIFEKNFDVWTKFQLWPKLRFFRHFDFVQNFKNFDFWATLWT